MARELVPVSFGTGSSVARSGLEGLTEYINAYVNQPGEEAKVSFSAYAINGTEALVSFGNDSTAIIRKLFEFDSVLLAVVGRVLYSTTENGDTPVTVGGIPSDGFVTAARNRQTPSAQVVFVCDGQYFVYQAGSLVNGADPDLPPPICVIEINGYFVFLIADGRFFITDIDDVTVDGLDFASAESNADANVMGAKRGRDLLIMGKKTTQFYQDNGAADFPFALVTTIDVGCYAAGSVANIHRLKSGTAATDTVIWAATDAQGAFSSIMILEGYNAVPISTDEVNRKILAEPDPSAIRSMGWTEDGHAFYCIWGTSFSMCWDTRTERWHKRRSFNMDRWRMGTHAHIGRSVVFGSNVTNKCYVSRSDLLTEDGDPIIFTIITPHIHMYPKPFKLYKVFIDVLTGVGQVTNDDWNANPRLMLDYSRNGGQSWGALREPELGAAAQRQVRVKERGYGRFDENGVNFRISNSASVLKGVLSMAVEIEPCEHA
jgi:hypothetical protein